ncbi:hypothetical protein C6503_11105 [Candidatus Poribacteria bacterium]|nr:MAG: hypothetical protein C6503_11105 [Candidatus Poribacteria bacterium]
MSNNFNELLLQTLKDVGIRLERLEGRVDHVINEKADKTDVKEVKADLKSVIEKLDQKADKADVNTLRDEVRSQGQRLDRIEMGIKTLQWTMTAGIAVLGIILAFVRSC